MQSAEQRSLKSRKRTKPASARVGFTTIGNANSAVNGSSMHAIIGNCATNARIARDRKERGKWRLHVIIAGTLFYDMRGIFPMVSIIVHENAWKKKEKLNAFTKYARFAGEIFLFMRL